MSSHLNRVQNFTKVKKYEYLELTWDSQVSSHLIRVQNFTNIKKYEFLNLTWDSHGLLIWIKLKKSKKYKYLKHTWNSHVYALLNKVLKKSQKIQVPETHVRFSGVFSSDSSSRIRIKKIKKYKFVKLTRVSHTYSHQNQV